MSFAGELMATEATSQFFADSVSFDDQPSYESPDQDVDTSNINLSTPYIDTRLDIGGAPLVLDGFVSSTPQDSEPRTDVWDGFAEQGDMMGPEQRPFFIDPDFYGPGSEVDQTLQQQYTLATGPVEDFRQSFPRTVSSRSLSLQTSTSGSISTGITLPEQLADQPEKPIRQKRQQGEQEEQEEAQDPPRKRRTRKTKRETVSAEDEEKRNRFLERNRMAASKCREKKKLYVMELEEAKNGLEQKNARLQFERDSLVLEIGQLKHQLMAHASCNDPNIDTWINREARKYVEESAGREEEARTSNDEAWSPLNTSYAALSFPAT